MDLHNGVAPEEDMLHKPVAAKNWSESYAFWAWDDRNDLTVYAHFQRHPEKPLIWRAYCSVMVGSDVYVMHTYGKQRSERGPGFESIHMECEDPHKSWRFRTEGAAQLRTAESLFGSATLDGPATPLNVDVRFECRTPLWSIPHSASGTSEIMPAHYEQKGRVKGFIEIGDKRFEVDCLGANDHSYGVRDTSALQVTDSGFFNCAMPSGRSFTAITMAPGKHVGYVNNGDGKLHHVNHIELPLDAWEAGQKGVVIAEGDGVRLEAAFEITPRRVVMTMIPPNYEHMGLLHGDNTRLAYGDFTCAVEWDGERGVGSWERCRFNPNGRG